MSDLCIPFLHNFHLKNPFVVYKRVYVKDPKFLEVPWKEDRNRISGLQNATAQGSEFYFLLCGFTGCRHTDFTLNFLQTRMKTGFRQTHSAHWTCVSDAPRHQRFPLHAALCPCPALHPSRSRWAHSVVGSQPSVCLWFTRGRGVCPVAMPGSRAKTTWCGYLRDVKREEFGFPRG